MRASLLVLAALAAGLAAGIAIGRAWFRGEPQSCLYAPGKFANPPPPGEKPQVIVGLDPQYPPFTQLLPNGSIVGFDVDLMKRIGRACGFEPVFKPWDWATIVEALTSGDVDVIASGMTITAARSQKVWFSVPYYFYTHYLVVRAGDNRSVDEILRGGVRVAVQTGSTADMLAERLIAEGYRVEKVGVESYPAALLAVVSGRADAGIFDSAFLMPYLRKNPSLAAQVRIVGSLGPTKAYAIATRPGDKWLRDCINSALERLMESPEWRELLEKWGLG